MKDLVVKIVFNVKYPPISPRDQEWSERRVRYARAVSLEHADGIAERFRDGMITEYEKRLYTSYAEAWKEATYTVEPYKFKKYRSLPHISTKEWRRLFKRPAKITDDCKFGHNHMQGSQIWIKRKDDIVYGMIREVTDQGYMLADISMVSPDIFISYDSIITSHLCNDCVPIDLKAVCCRTWYDRYAILDNLDRGLKLLVDDKGLVFVASTGAYIANVRHVKHGTGDWCRPMFECDGESLNSPLNKLRDTISKFFKYFAKTEIKK